MTSPTMRAVRCHAYGGPEVLRLERVDIPEPAPGEILIATEAVSVGYAQTQMRRNLFPAPVWHPSFPIVLGGDVVGVVASVGKDVEEVREGDRVSAFTLYGAYADYVAVDASSVVAVPEDLDAAEAAVLPGTGPIAFGTLDVGQLAQGESVLVHAAAGGIGHLSVQLAKLAGAGQVIATASSTAKQEFARSLGADAGVDSTSADWAERVLAITGGRGVDVILDSAGGDALRKGIGVLAPGGRLVFYGSSAGELDIPSIPVMELIGMKYITGFALSAWRTAYPARFREGVAELVEHMRDGRVKSEVYASLPLAEAARAHELVESRTHTGRVVLIP